MGSINDDVVRIRTLFESELLSAETLDALQGIRIRFLGKKGEVTSLLKRLGSLPAEDRPEAGRVLNELRDLMEEALSRRTEECAGAQVAAREAGEWLDVTLQGGGAPGVLSTLSPRSPRKR